MTQKFEPIAIVGRGCILPGCNSPYELWETVAEGRSQITEAPAGDWRIAMDRVLDSASDRYTPDRAWTDKGGYIRGFAEKFDATETAIDPDLIARLDPVFQWSIYAARQAMADVRPGKTGTGCAGLILGNLSYPTRLHTRLAEQTWLFRLLGKQPPAGGDVHAWNRFMSGLPAMLAAQACGFGGGSLALDAACASGLYAIKIACDRLQDGRADLMLAGAVNAADQLFLHVGFSALNALSRSGRSRPFHRDADGLLPAEGAAFVALKRLDDALSAGDRIFGIIRGVGLSNDGRSGGFLSPSQAGQVRSMQSALAQAGFSPDAVQYVECHATGTALGDATEIKSLNQVYGNQDLALGSLKANLGHLITASGIAGLLKTLSAMEHETMPSTPDSRPLSGALAETGFNVPEQNEVWQARDGQRTAAVSSFGFGGNNAHLIVEQYPIQRPDLFGPAPKMTEEVAIVGLGIRTQLDSDANAFAERLLGDGSTAAFEANNLKLSAKQLLFPPNELKQALGQQLILLDVARQATAGLAPLDAERCGVFVGMHTDSEVCRYGLRARWPELIRQAGLDVDDAWLTASEKLLSPRLDSAGVIGKMPNISANRISNAMDIRGPGFAVSREELSGDAALDMACTAIRRGEIDTALVAAVDLCREEVHEQAALAILGDAGKNLADAAVMLVVKSRAQAERDGDKILALVASSESGDADLSNAPADSPVYGKLGHAHAASGLLHIALGVQMLRARTKILPDGRVQPWLRNNAPLQLAIRNRSFSGETAQWTLCEASAEVLHLHRMPELNCYAADNPDALTERLQANRTGGDGPCRLALVAEPEQLDGLREKALQVLKAGQGGDAWNFDGISYRRKPLAGELAYVFTGAASAYPAMGRELLLGMPQLADGLADRLKNPAAAAAWAYTDNDSRAKLPFYQLAGSSFLCQLHTQLSRELLGLKPSASIGLSSGETNAMFAFGVWQDIDGLFTDINASGLYTEALAERFDAVRGHWGLAADAPLDWENYRVRFDAAELAAAVAKTSRVYLTIINSPQDCVIGGERSACEAMLSALGNPPAVPLGHDLAIHCPAVLPFEPVWRELHTRPTQINNRLRFYSNYFSGVIEPNQQSVADALTGQALQTIDFPSIVNLAWQDGVRIFVEHGPRNSLSTAISEILGDKEHLAVALDRSGVPALTQAYRAAAQLWCAGVDVNLEQLIAQGRALQHSLPEATGPEITFQLRPPKIVLPPLRQPAPVGGNPAYLPPALRAGAPDGRLIPAAPPLAYLIPVPERIVPSIEKPDAEPVKAAPIQPSLSPTQAVAETPGTSATLAAMHQRLAEAHIAYLQAQAQAMQDYTAFMQRIYAGAFGNGPADNALFQQPAPVQVEQVAPAVPEKRYPGPAFSREQLEILAGGEISSVFGEAFAMQDRYAVQVRMPEPPLLLCDRVLGIDGEAHSMGLGTIWTETDVRADSWYLHHGRMPAGIFIESGQADLLLISWLGIDNFNKGERAYRLLGCDLVFHGQLPEPGDTLEYEIKVDGHARQGDVRLFFFHYDCRINGELRISVRNGQAGFFSKQELQNSAGVIWTPEEANYTAEPRLTAPPQPTLKSSFSQTEVEAYLNGDLAGCFGDAFYWADTHTRTPTTPKGRHNFLGAVTRLDFNGGPAGRGYLRVDKPVRPDEWFFDGHFKNDPCMPGTLMAEACLQAMAFYIAAMGWTLPRDGWRFQPVSEQSYTFICRGQVTPESKHIVYELFIDEVCDGDMPMIFAHVLCSVDGLKAFLCERLGLQLVPDWPLSSMPEYLAEDRKDTRPLAYIGDFPLDYRSLIHCAWGKPTRAFGQGFAHYDGPRRSPRLPGPPYHFMTRIVDLHGEMAKMQAGARVTALYDLEPDAWYFNENVSATMPNCVLMEVALQPCGWLASYTLQRQASERELLFRNLDGDSVQYREVGRADRTITSAVELLSVSQVGDMIIEKFSVHCTVDGEDLLKVETVFGFFPPAAMVNQKGFDTGAEDRALLELHSDTRIEFKDNPEILFGSGSKARLPTSKLLMLDRIAGHWPEGGAAGLGAIRAEKDVNSKDWFFKAHFFQDPVQPGSLGVEAMLQAIQSLMLLQGMDKDIERPRFEPIDIGGRTQWHYRGQVTPDKNKISVEFEVSEQGRDRRGAFVIGQARLWVDNLQIYQAPRIGMRIVPDDLQSASMQTVRSWQLDLDDPKDAWIKDHRPTYTLPALPLTYELELMAEAAAPLFVGMRLQTIEYADAKQWVVFASSLANGRTLVDLIDATQADVTLQQRNEQGEFVSAATARLRFGSLDAAAGLAPLEPLRDARLVEENPYADASLFHGPSLQLMHGLNRGSNGAYAAVHTRAGTGLLNPILLDVALHCIPHNNYRLWCPSIEPGMAAYPIRIEKFRLFTYLAVDGEVNVDARFVSLESGRFPRTHLRISQGGIVLAAFDLVEILLPKGRLGLAEPTALRAFLRDRRYGAGIALSETGATRTQLKRLDVSASDWLPGTLARVYGVFDPNADLARQIALKDHVGAQLRLHPSLVAMDADERMCLNLPLNRYQIEVQENGDTVVVSGEPPACFAWENIRRDWLARMDGDSNFVIDLGLALIRRFVRRVVLTDPEGYSALQGKPVLYLGNHQTGVESFLFLSIVTTLARVPAGAIAKQEHRETWIGAVHKLADLAMGPRNPLRMFFFDRAQQSDMLRLLHEFGSGLESNPCSLLVHVDGTRSQAAGMPVRAVSSVLIDLALRYELPIVPVRFAGGLPIEPAAERLEFPYRLGRQDYYLGQAIHPETLRSLPYAQRAQLIAERINSLGPAGIDDIPIADDGDFARRVEDFRAGGHDALRAVLHATLAELPERSETTERLLDDAPLDGADNAIALALKLLGRSAPA
ncbi:MAG: beta-ketoacyl synthase N-terminal-like domain-containing protein [Methylobacter sp.]